MDTIAIPKLRSRSPLLLIQWTHQLALSVGATMIATFLTSGILTGEPQRATPPVNLVMTQTARPPAESSPDPDRQLTITRLPQPLLVPHRERLAVTKIAPAETVVPPTRARRSHAVRTTRTAAEKAKGSVNARVERAKASGIGSMKAEPAGVPVDGVDGVLPAARQVVRSGLSLVASASTFLADAVP